MPASTTRTSRDPITIIAAMAAALLMALMLSLPSQATEHSFEEALIATQASAQAELDDLNATLESSPASLADEAFLMGPLRESLSVGADTLSAYADAVEALDAPTAMAADVERHVSALRELSSTLMSGAEAAAAGDRTGVDAADDSMASLLATLAGELGPTYAELAFISPVDYDFLGVFGALDADDRAYLDGVLEAMDEWDRRLARFQQIMGSQYPSPEALFAALYDAGAGEAWAAVEAKAATLTPSPRFEDEHAWWLDRLAIQAEVDGRIGEAMRDGDMTKFATENIRLGLLPYPYSGFDAAFGAAVDNASPLMFRLDPAAVTTMNSEYLQGLFDALRGPGSVDIFEGIGSALFELPGATDETAMAAIDETGPEMRAAFEELEVSVSALEPPADLAADHALISGYLESAGGALDTIIESSVVGDGDAVLDGFDAYEDSYCSTASSLSGDIEPVSSVYFNRAAFICRP